MPVAEYIIPGMLIRDHLLPVPLDWQKPEGQSIELFLREVVDPTGAGDCFGATFVSMIAQGFAFGDALRFANAAGALAVGKTGPMEGNSSLAEIKAFLGKRP